MDDDLQHRIGYALNGDEADVVLCDAAPSTTGNSEMDHTRCVDMAKAGLGIANAVLRNGGVFVVKVFRGEEEPQLVKALRTSFLKSKPVKPKASVKESREIYYFCAGFVPEQLREGQGLTDEQIDEAMRAGTGAAQSDHYACDDGAKEQYPVHNTGGDWSEETVQENEQRKKRVLERGAM